MEECAHNQIEVILYTGKNLFFGKCDDCKNYLDRNLENYPVREIKYENLERNRDYELRKKN